MQNDRLLLATVSDVDGNIEGRRGTISIFDGRPPKMEECRDIEHECQFVGAWITERLLDGCLPHEIGVFVRSDNELKRARAAVKLAGVRSVELGDKIEFADGAVAISTMHYAMGLEFRSVAVMVCDDDVIPQLERIETVADDA